MVLPFVRETPKSGFPKLEIGVPASQTREQRVSILLTRGKDSKEKGKALMRIAIIQLLTGKILGQTRVFLNLMISLDSIGNGYDQNAEIWLLKGLCLQQTTRVRLILHYGYGELSSVE